MPSHCGSSLGLGLNSLTNSHLTGYKQLSINLMPKGINLYHDNSPCYFPFYDAYKDQGLYLHYNVTRSIIIITLSIVVYILR